MWSSFNAKCVSQETLQFPAVDYFKKIQAYLYRYLPIHSEGFLDSIYPTPGLTAERRASPPKGGVSWLSCKARQKDPSCMTKWKEGNYFKSSRNQGCLFYGFLRYYIWKTGCKKINCPIILVLRILTIYSPPPPSSSLSPFPSHHPSSLPQNTLF